MNNATTLAFVLTMPNIGSWNGKWSGEGNFYAITRFVFNFGDHDWLEKSELANGIRKLSNAGLVKIFARLIRIGLNFLYLDMKNIVLSDLGWRSFFANFFKNRCWCDREIRIHA